MTEKSTAGQAVGRFAPSPSGYLHLGNLLSALLAWLDIRSLGGEMVFRLEDLDPARSDPAFAEAMAEDLRWLGLDWDWGWPQDPGYAQSERTALYEEAFQTLKEQGLAYPCWCSRSKRLAAASAPHPGEQEADLGCRCSRMSQAEREALLKAGRNPAWKLNSPDQDIRINDGHYGLFIQNPAREAGDCIIRRSDGVFAYQLAEEGGNGTDTALGMIREIYTDYYKGSLVHFDPEGDENGFLAAGKMAGRDDMEIAVFGNEERILLTARFDNLGKGACGAAIQNMNLVLGVEETTGLVL